MDQYCSNFEVARRELSQIRDELCSLREAVHFDVDERKQYYRQQQELNLVGSFCHEFGDILDDAVRRRTRLLKRLDGVFDLLFPSGEAKRAFHSDFRKVENAQAALFATHKGEEATSPESFFAITVAAIECLESCLEALDLRGRIAPALATSGTAEAIRFPAAVVADTSTGSGDARPSGARQADRVDEGVKVGRTVWDLASELLSRLPKKYSIPVILLVIGAILWWRFG
ncbi:hypothetical protein HZA57_03680 [Candidatus Poribacteria bacterium]|nr:hypothetical protein [Candidatus Poribacteria bacterium]